MVRTMWDEKREGDIYTKFNLICIKTLPIKSEYTNCSQERHSAARKDQHNFPSSSSSSSCSFIEALLHRVSNIGEKERKKCNLRCFIPFPSRDDVKKNLNDSKMS